MFGDTNVPEDLLIVRSYSGRLSLRIQARVRGTIKADFSAEVVVALLHIHEL